MPLTPQRKAEIDALIASQRQQQPGMGTQPSNSQGQVAPSGGLTPERKAQIDAMIAQQKQSAPVVANQPTQNRENILTGVAKPFLRATTNVLNVAEGANKLLSGQDIGDSATRSRDFGIFGQDIRPVGVGEDGKLKNVGGFAKDVIGTGAEIGSYLAPVGIAGQAEKEVAKAALKTGGKMLPKLGVKALMKGGALSGALSSGGASLANGDSLKKTLSKTAGGALSGAAVSGAIPVLGEILKPVTKKVFPWATDAIQRSSLRLTPTQKQNLGSKVDDVADFLTQNKIVGTPKRRFDIVSDIYDQTENELQDFLQNSASGRTVNRDGLVSQVQKIADNYKYDRDALAIQRQLEGFVTTLNKQFPDEIPVDVLNNLKRSTFSGAYNKAGDKVLDTVEHDIGDVLYASLKDAVSDLRIGDETLEQFNRRYSTIINARKLLKIAKSKKQAGLIAKIVASMSSSAVGSSVGGPFGAAVGAAVGPEIAEQLSGGLVRSGAAVGLDSLSKIRIPNIGRPLAPVIPKILQDQN